MSAKTARATGDAAQPDQKTFEAEYPKGYDVPSLRERRFLWTARLFALIAIASLLLNIALTAAIVVMTPLKTVQPHLVEFARGSDVVASVKPIRKEMAGFPLLAESLVRKYVIDRETIPRTNRDNAIPLRDLWGPDSFLRLASTNDVWNRFAGSVSQVVARIRESQRSRHVEIVSVVPQSPLQTYLVEFESTIYGPRGQEIATRAHEALIEIAFSPSEGMTRTQALNNPTGFTVLSYDRYDKTN